MLEKLYAMGVLSHGSKLSEIERKVGVSAFARRRLGVVMTRLRMCERVSEVWFCESSLVSCTFGG